MRDAVDRYKDAADRGGFQTKRGQPELSPDLETLVKVSMYRGKKIRFRARFLSDPMTGTTEWGLRSMQDDPVPTPGGAEVFDVYTKSQGTGLDGTEV